MELDEGSGRRQQEDPIPVPLLEAHGAHNVKVRRTRVGALVIPALGILQGARGVRLAARCAPSGAGRLSRRGHGEPGDGRWDAGARWRAELIEETA